MLDILISMQIRAKEERRLAAYFPKGSTMWKRHTSTAEQLEEQIKNVTEVAEELFGNYGMYPDEQKEAKEKKKELCECPPNAKCRKGGCHC